MDNLTELLGSFEELPSTLKQQLQQQLSCSWWGLPTEIQEKLKKTFCEGKNSWELQPYKNPDGSWGFDLPMLLTINEKLIGGTDLCMDYYWEEITGTKPQTGDKLKMTCSSKPIEDQNLILEYQGDDFFDPDSSYYLDPKSGITCWLCPYLTFLFGDKPSSLYIKLTKLS